MTETEEEYDVERADSTKAGDDCPPPTAPPARSVFTEMMDRGRESAEVVIGTAITDDEFVSKEELDELRQAKEELQRIKERQIIKDEIREELRAEMAQKSAQPSQTIVVQANQNAEMNSIQAQEIKDEPPEETRGEWFSRQHWCIKIIIIFGAIIAGILWFVFFVLKCFCEMIALCAEDEEVVVVRRRW